MEKQQKTTTGKIREKRREQKTEKKRGRRGGKGVGIESMTVVFISQSVYPLGINTNRRSGSQLLYKI